MKSCILKKYFASSFIFLGIIFFSCGEKQAADGVLINDISRLNPTYVKQIIPANSLKSLQKAVRLASEKNLKISISGKRHSQGGHAFYDGAVVLDMTHFNQIIDLDVENKIITVQSGTSWEQIQEYINPYNLSVKSMQSSNIFTVGGSMSSNIHGRDARNSLIVKTIQDFRLLLPTGEIVNVSRKENIELFKLVIGGYGLFGVILDITLNLTDNHILQKEAHIIDYTEFPAFFENFIVNDPNVELFIARPSIAPSSLLRETVVTIWKRTNIQKPQDDKIFDLQSEKKVWRDKFFFSWSRRTGLGKEIRWYLQKRLVAQINKTDYITRNNAMRPPTAPLKFLDYKSDKDTDIIQEYFIPVDKFADFIDGVRLIVEQNKVNLLGVTIRYVEKNNETFLSYGKKKAFSVVVYSNQELSPSGVQKAKTMTIKLVDLAINNGGIYYLTYQLFPTQKQIRLAYPKIDQFFEKKLRYDNQELFMNKFYKHYAYPSGKRDV